jgi:hypothetical protein
MATISIGGKNYKEGSKAANAAIAAGGKAGAKLDTVRPAGQPNTTVQPNTVAQTGSLQGTISSSSTPAKPAGSKPVSVVTSDQGETFKTDTQQRLDTMYGQLSQAAEQLKLMRMAEEAAKKEEAAAAKKNQGITDFSTSVLGGTATGKEKTGTDLLTSQTSLDDLWDEAGYKKLQSQLTAATASVTGLAGPMIANIQEQFAVRKEQMKQINAESLAGLTVMGYRSNRAQYAPEIQESLLTSEERSGIARLAELDVQEQTKILEVESLMADKKYKLAREAMDDFKSAQDAKVKAVKELYQQTMDNEKWALDKKIKQAQLAENTVKAADTVMSQWALSGMEPSANDFIVLGKTLGVAPQAAANIYNAKAGLFRAQTLGDMADAQSKMVDLLKSVPAGMDIQMPDGTTYKGMGSSGDYYMSTQTDDAGNVTLVKVNKLTNEVQLQGLGKFGKSDSGGSEKNNNILLQRFSPEIRTQLLASMSKEQITDYVAEVIEDSKPGGKLHGIDLSDSANAELITSHAEAYLSIGGTGMTLPPEEEDTGWKWPWEQK